MGTLRFIAMITLISCTGCDTIQDLPANNASMNVEGIWTADQMEGFFRLIFEIFSSI